MDSAPLNASQMNPAPPDPEEMKAAQPDRAQTTAHTEELWNRFYGELYAFVRGRVRTDDVAQDVLQSAFLQAHRYLVSGKTLEQPRAWLYRIARNPHCRHAASR